MNSGELNGAGKFFAKENCDELTKIRKMFLEALDGAGENYRKSGAVENETKFSKSSNKRLTNGKNKGYNSTKSVKLTPEMIQEYNEKHRYVTMENRAQPVRGSTLYWVNKKGLFSVEENSMFHSMIKDIKQGGRTFTQNIDGDYMLPINNKIVFTDGDFYSPIVSRVIEVMTDYSTRFEDIRSVMFDVEKGRSNLQDATQYVRDFAGEKCAYEYKSNVDGAYEWTTGRRERKNRRRLVEDYIKSQNRERNTRVSGEDIRKERNDESRGIFEQDSGIKLSFPLADLYDLNASNIEKVTELGKVAAQLTAHINYIGSSQTKRTLRTLNIQTVARELKKEYHSKADIHELTPLLEELYKLFEQGRVSSDVVKAHVDST